MPLTLAGYSAPRAADLLATIRAAYVAELAARGLATDPDWERDTFLGVITAITADRLGDLAEEVQALYDAFTPANAAGVPLDDLCALVGVYRQPATASTAAVTLTGTPATVIPAGSVVAGGGPDDLARWTLDAATTIGGGGTVAGAVTCTEVGAIAATIGQIDQIATPIAGWASVTNAAAAVVGQARESDAVLRVRRASTLAAAGNRTLAALRADLLALDYLDGAVVLDNDSDAAATVEGVALAAHSIAVVVYPSGLTLAQVEEVAGVIYEHTAAGVYVNGSDEVVDVVGDDGSAKTVRFDYAASVGVTVGIGCTLATGYTLAEVAADVEAAVTAYFDALAVGQAARRLELFGVLSAVDGLVACTLDMNTFSTDITAQATERLTLAAISVL